MQGRLCLTEPRTASRKFYHVYSAVGLQYGVLYLADVQTTLVTQLLHQLIGGKAVFYQAFLYNTAVFNENFRLSEKQCTQFYAFHGAP